MIVQSHSEASLIAYAKLEESIRTALETYSNVHRGSGHFSKITTSLFEKSRGIILDYFNLKSSKYIIVFCSERGEALLRENLHIVKNINSSDIGLPLGIRAVAIKKNTAVKKIRFLAGGGTARLISPNWVVWENGAAGFEAGTPPVINIIALARALQIIKEYGAEIFIGNKHSAIQANIILHEDDLGGVSGKELLEKIRHSLIGHNTRVPTTEGIRPYVNLDHSSSTPAIRQVWEVAREMLHQPVNMRQDIIEETGSVCSSFFDATKEDYDIIYTSNATEALNLAAENLDHHPDTEIEPVILTTILEHSSNDLPWRAVKNLTLVRLMVNSSGLVDLTEMEATLDRFNREHQEGKQRVVLVSVTGASNVLGIFNDIEGIAHIAHEYGARILVDAAQMAAHKKIEMAKWGIDLLAFSSHKTYAPFGSGALIARKGLLNFPKAKLESIRSSGEENLAGIAALGKALQILSRIGIDLIMEEEHSITGLAISEMNKINGIRIFGLNDPGKPEFKNKGPVISFSIESKWPHKLAPALAERGGIGIRFGCHCAHMLVKHLVGVGPKLEKFQRIMISLFPKLNFPGVARISMGLGNTPEDISHLSFVVQEILSVPDPPVKEIRKKIAEYNREITRKIFALA